MVDEDDARRDAPIQPPVRAEAAAPATARGDAPPTSLELRARSELTAPEGAGFPGSTGRDGDTGHPTRRSEAHTALFTRLDDLSETSQEHLFGPSAQRALYVYYAEGPTLVGAVLDPPVAVHAPSENALEARIRTYVAEHRGVVEADVHPFGRRMDRDHALSILASRGY